MNIQPTICMIKGYLTTVHILLTFKQEGDRAMVLIINITEKTTTKAYFLVCPLSGVGDGEEWK